MATAQHTLVNRTLFGALLASVLLVGAAHGAPVNVTAQRSISVGDLAIGTVFGPNSPSSALRSFFDVVTVTVGVPRSPQPANALQGSNIDPVGGIISG